MLLVAAPTLLDPNFADTVVLLLEADADGAVGVVLNRPTPVPVEEVLADWGAVVAEPEVLFQGGPVSTEGALAVGLLAGAPEVGPGLRPVAGGFALVDLDGSVEQLAGRLEALRIFAGYAGWGAGQLQDEIAEGAWYVVPSLAADLCREDTTGLWRDVLRRQPGELAWHSTRPVDADLN
jgi:putative transcriptional regulator